VKKLLYTVLVLLTLSTQSYALWSDTLSGCWSMNESAGSTRVDSIGGFNATDSGTVGSVAGVVGNAASFSGDNSLKLQTTAGMTTNLHFNAAHSIAFWIHPTSFVGGTGHLYIANDSNAGGYYFQIFIHMPEKTLEADNAGGFGCVNASSTVLSVNTTYFVALTDAGGTNNCILYINAVSDNTVSSSFPSEAEADKFAFGRKAATTGNPFYGWIDEMMTFTSALSSGDVSTIYNSGAGQACVAANKVKHRSRILKLQQQDLGIRYAAWQLERLLLPRIVLDGRISTR